MRLLIAGAAVALASPQGCCMMKDPPPNTRTRDNQILTKSVTLAEVAPPADAILIRTHNGLVRVALDGSSTTPIDVIPSAMTSDGSIRIHVVGGKYVLRSDQGER